MPKKTPLMKTEVIHRLPGRLRVRVRGLKYLSSVEGSLSESLGRSSYFKAAKVNTVTGSLLVEYDEEALSVGDVLEIIEGKINGFSLLALQKEREHNNQVTVNERRLNEASVSEFVKRIAISAASLAFFGLHGLGKAGITGIDAWRTNILSAPAIVSMLLSKDILTSGVQSMVQDRRPNADTLTSTAVITAILTGRSMAALTTILLSDVAELMTAYTMERTRNAIKNMLSVGDDEVFVVQDDGTLSLKPLEEVRIGDVVSIQNGDKLSVDGIVEKGDAYIDEAAITGEYFPAHKEVGAQVFAGTIVGSGQMHVRVNRIGDNTTVAKIVRMVEDAAGKKAQIQTFADRFSAQLIPLNFALAAAVYLGTRDINRALSMMIIDYSCGVRLSTATALSACINNAARNGVLIKGGNYVESLASADALVLDKTGTVTEGRPKIVTVHPLEGVTEKMLLTHAAAAEEDSTHPLAQAILERVRKSGYAIPKHDMIQVDVGKGVTTTIEDKQVLVGNRRYLMQMAIPLESEVLEEAKQMEQRGEIVIYVAFDGACLGLLGLHDSLKENMKKALNRLRYMGYDDIRLLTGDQAFQAEKVASRMHMDGFEAELMPEEKAHTVLQMQSGGAKVVMIGDGINDAPALAYADIGVAIGNTRTDVAIESADVTITNDDPLLIPSAIGMARRTMRIIKENFGVVVGVNTVGIVLSAVGYLPVIWGSILHNSTTIFVVLNSGRLLIKDFERRTYI